MCFHSPSRRQSAGTGLRKLKSPAKRLQGRQLTAPNRVRNRSPTRLAGLHEWGAQHSVRNACCRGPSWAPTGDPKWHKTGFSWCHGTALSSIHAFSCRHKAARYGEMNVSKHSNIEFPVPAAGTPSNQHLGAKRMADLTSTHAGASRASGTRIGAVAAICGVSLLLGGCLGDSGPEVRAVQAQPAPAPVVEPYQIASAPVVMSDGTIVPIPRAKPARAGKPLDQVTRSDAKRAAPLDGPQGLVEKAAAYRAFEDAIDELGQRKFKSPRDVRAALDSLRPHEPKHLGEGWVANSAFLAAAQPEFVAALKSAVDRDGKAAVLGKLRSGTGVWMFAGSQQARSAVVADAAEDYKKLTNLGQRFLTTAVEFQRTRWGSYEQPAPFSTSPQFAAADVGGMDLGSILAEVAGIGEAQAAIPVMQRILAIAGHIALDESDGNAAVSLVQNRDLSRCTRFARLNLNQCLAAAHFPSEEAYCTGKHAVNEIAYCWATYLPAAAK